MINIVNNNQGKVQISKKNKQTNIEQAYSVNSCKPCSCYAGRVLYQHRVNGVKISGFRMVGGVKKFGVRGEVVIFTF